MMISKPKASYILFAACVVRMIIADVPANCSHSCGGDGGGGGADRLPFPFGFSSGCPIRLNCSANGTAVIHGFPVRSVTSDAILLDIPGKCGRPAAALRSLFGWNYAPTSQNGILLDNCSSPAAVCLIPMAMVHNHFRSLDCGTTGGNISCYAEPSKERNFIDYDATTKSGCRSLFSAFSAESSDNSSAVPLDVEAVRLGWWVDGNCESCSPNASCTPIVSPVDGRPGYRCACIDGFVGDGFRAGSGCRKASSPCNPAKYVSGQCGGTTRVVVLVGGAAAGASLMISLGLAFCFMRRRFNRRNRTKYQISEGTGINVPIFPYKEIDRATNGFSEKQQLGTGAYGTVYLGKLRCNKLAAIKRIKRRDSYGTEQVMNETKLLSSVNHPHLVSLLGCSIDKGELILVYEFMPNGTLSQHLHGGSSNGPLSWLVRLTIATETAQGIAYLHSAMNPPIYHRDIKSSNILLDNNFKTKVADFGLSRLGMVESSYIITAPQGTPGYVDPQYHQDFHLSDKSDVYSFGVVLVEIITALKAVDFSRPHNEVNLAALAIDRIGKGRLEEIIDPFLEPFMDDWALSSVHKVAELAFRCLAFHRDMRPSMMEVADELEQIRLSRWASSEENIAASWDASTCSSSSTDSELQLSVTVKKTKLESRFSVSSMEKVGDFSPVSVQDPWLSEQSSPSSNS